MKQQTNFSKRTLRSSLTMAFFLALCGVAVASTLVPTQAQAASQNISQNTSQATFTNRMLANMKDIVSLTATDHNSVGIFLSYAGKHMNHCGIAIRVSTYASIQDFADKVAILDMNGKEIGEMTKEGYVGKVADPDAMLFGESFIIQSRDGQKLATTIASLSTAEPTDAIAEILPCE